LTDDSVIKVALCDKIDKSHVCAHWSSINVRKSAARVYIILYPVSSCIVLYPIYILKIKDYSVDLGLRFLRLSSLHTDLAKAQFYNKEK
jgi:hypothetical protein